MSAFNEKKGKVLTERGIGRMLVRSPLAGLDHLFDGEFRQLFLALQQVAKISKRPVS